MAVPVSYHVVPINHEGSAMPRFFFDLNDDRYQRDDTGSELPNLSSAEQDAVRMLGEIIRFDPERLVGRGLRVTIRNGESEEVGAVTAALERHRASA